MEENKPQNLDEKIYHGILDDSGQIIDQAGYILIITIMPLMVTIIIALNLTVVISSIILYKREVQPRNVYIFLGNISMADLLIGICLIMGLTFPKEKLNYPACVLMIGLIVSGSIVSIFSVALIAFDRYLYIVHGMHYKIWFHQRKVGYLILIVWIIGFIIGFLPAFNSTRDTIDGRICWFLLAPPEIVMIVIFTGFVPIVISCVFYSIILYHAIKKVYQLRKMTSNKLPMSTDLRAFRGSASGNHNNPDNTPSTWKAIKVVLFTTGAIIIAWVPYYIACILYIFTDEKTSYAQHQRLKFALSSPLAILGYTNSVLNPLIYAWFHHGFRKNIKKLYFKQKVRISQIFHISGKSRVNSETVQSVQ